MKAFKKLLIIFAVLAVLAAGGLYALARFAPIERVQQKAVQVVKERTGRDLSFSDARIMFWPNVGVRLQDVALSNAAWSSEENMMTLGALDIRLALRPLLQKQVEVKRFVLKEPVIHLEVSADGQRNWVFPRAGDAPAAEGGEAAAEQGGGLPGGVGFRMDEFEISGGRLTFADAQKKTSYVLEDVNVTISFPDLQSAFQLDGALSYLGKRVQLVARFDTPMALAEGKSSPGNLLVKTDDLNANMAGTFATSGTLLRDGRIEAAVGSLPNLVGWLTGKPAAELPFRAVSFTSGAEASASMLNLTEASLTLDDIAANGDVRLDLDGLRPAIRARLNIGKLNLDRFVGAAADREGGAKKDAAVPEQDWDATPIDFSALKAVDADLVLNTQGFSLKGAEVGPSTLKAMLKNGALQASSSEASLFGGVFSSSLSLDASGATPSQAFTFDMKGVQAMPVLETFADFRKLSGTVDADVSVTSAGNSQKQIIGNLNGRGATTFKNGAITGIDIVNIAQMVQRGLKDAGIGEGKTEFVELGGTFTINKGIVHNEDLKMKGPLVQLSGAGDVDLPKKYVRYRIKPVLTASSAVEGAGGIGVPVDISGPFSNIRVKPDLSSIVKQAISDPEALKAQGKALEDNFKQIKKDPGKAIENLLGGGGLFGKPAEKAPAEGAGETAGETAGEAATGEAATGEPAGETAP